MKLRLALLLPLVLTTATSCLSISRVDLSHVDTWYLQGDAKQAAVTYEKNGSDILDSQGRLVYSLDVGMLTHFAGDYARSNEYLGVAETLIAEAYTQSVTENISRFIINDNAKTYPGEDYEDIYSNIFMSLNYQALGRTEDAMVEIRRSSEKERLLIDKYSMLMEKSKSAKSDRIDGELQTISFSKSALSNYLGMLYSDALGNIGDRDYYRRSVLDAFAIQPTLYPFPVPDSAENRPDPEIGKVRLEFIAFTGMGPTKFETVRQLYVSKNNYAKLALPILVPRNGRVDGVTVRLDNGVQVRLQRIEDLSRIAQDTFALRFQSIYNRTVIRTMAKATGTAVLDTIADGARNSDEQGSESVAMISDILSVFSSIFNQTSESADLRISHYFPAVAWVGYVDVDPGLYEASFNFESGSSTLRRQRTRILASPGSLNLHEGFCPL
ncbi:MAG: hypothetical protein ACOX6K_04370 [Sphaerochaetaceae bacterium]|jgi:hypothetical protein